MGLAHGAHAPVFADTHMTLVAKNNNGTKAVNLLDS